MTAAAEGRPVDELVVGVLGGTGPQGRGLAVRLAAVGQRVLLGSRDADRAREVAEEVAGRAATVSGGEVSVQGGSNLDVAGAADLVIVAVPYAGHAATLAELRRTGRTPTPEEMTAFYARHDQVMVEE